MKATGTALWNSPNQDATNSSGFAGLPGGYRAASNGAFSNVGYYGIWWSSSVYGPTFPTYAWARYLRDTTGAATRINYGKSFGLSVRCLRD